MRPRAGSIALGLAASALLCASLSGPGMYLGFGVGTVAVALGWIGYRRGTDPGWARLAGAGAISLGVLAVVASGARYAITLAAISRLESYF